MVFSDSRKLQNLHPKIQDPLIMILMTISKPNYFYQRTIRFELAVLIVQ